MWRSGGAVSMEVVDGSVDRGGVDEMRRQGSNAFKFFACAVQEVSLSAGSWLRRSAYRTSSRGGAREISTQGLRWLCNCGHQNRYQRVAIGSSFDSLSISVCLSVS